MMAAPVIRGRTQAQPVHPGNAAGQTPQRDIALWLLTCAGFVLAVLVVGGITRLTHSGLSIVQWQPLVGIVPPTSPAAWATLFEQYRATPEFQLVNPAMTLAQFEPIFWWEYTHRLLARLAGLVFLLPFLWFVGSRRIGAALTWRLAAIFTLGALQGALGWYMVASGLIDDPRVSPLRLSAHLGLALALIGAMLWTAWSLWLPGPRRRAAALALLSVATVFVMALTGALVSGTRAGFAYNSFPWMDGALVPPQLLQLSPWYRNFLDNLATVQFVHRAMACVVLATMVGCWWRMRWRMQPLGARALRASNAMLLALALQLGLGIATLLSVVALPLAAAHQAGAVLLFAATLWNAFALCQAEDAARG